LSQLHLTLKLLCELKVFTMPYFHHNTCRMTGVPSGPGSRSCVC